MERIVNVATDDDLDAYFADLQARYGGPEALAAELLARAERGGLPEGLFPKGGCVITPDTSTN